jgi:hypothetical protein
MGGPTCFIEEAVQCVHLVVNDRGSGTDETKYSVGEMNHNQKKKKISEMVVLELRRCNDQLWRMFG